MPINQLLDKAKECRSHASDAALAANLGVTRQSLHAWRQGTAHPSEEHVARLAGMCGFDPGEWLVKIKTETATGEALAAWKALAKRLAAAVACLVAAAGIVGANNGTMTPAESRNYHDIHYAHCAMRRIRRIFALWPRLWAAA